MESELSLTVTPSFPRSVVSCCQAALAALVSLLSIAVERDSKSALTGSDVSVEPLDDDEDEEDEEDQEEPYWGYSFINAVSIVPADFKSPP